jgi:hypothetical protein
MYEGLTKWIVIVYSCFVTVECKDIAHGRNIKRVTR